MAKFPGTEWLDLYKDAINKSEKHKEVGATWEGDLTYLVEAEPALNVPENVCIWMDLWHGECRDAKIVDVATGERARFLISAPYSRWKEVLLGKLEPTKGMMQGKLKLKGDLPQIVQHVAAANELVAIAMSIPTEFPDE